MSSFYNYKVQYSWRIKYVLKKSLINCLLITRGRWSCYKWREIVGITSVKLSNSPDNVSTCCQPVPLGVMHGKHVISPMCCSCQERLTWIRSWANYQTKAEHGTFYKATGLDPSKMKCHEGLRKKKKSLLLGETWQWQPNAIYKWLDPGFKKKSYKEHFGDNWGYLDGLYDRLYNF